VWLASTLVRRAQKSGLRETKGLILSVVWALAFSRMANGMQITNETSNRSTP